MAQLASNQSPAPPRPKAKCPICQGIVKHPSVLSYLQCHQTQSETAAAAPSDTSTNGHNKERIYYTSRKYIDAFLQSPEYETLLQIEFHGVNNMRRIRKEVTESYSALHLLQRYDLNHTFLVDLCSGKSLTTVLCGLMYPRGRFLAIDKLPSASIAHNIMEYWSCDVMSKQFAQRLVNEIQAEAKQQRNIILVGMHLCGTLSERAIDLFAQNAEIEALLLCPCCLPRNPKGVVAQMRKDLRNSDSRSNNDMYRGWVEVLYEQLRAIPGVTIERCIDVDMHTDRNRLLWVTRNQKL